MSLDYPDRNVWLAKRTKSYTLQRTASLRERYLHVSVNVWKHPILNEGRETGLFEYHRTPKGSGITYKKPKAA